MLSLTIETATYRAVVWLSLGILAFGFGILYMQRFSGEEQPFTEVFTAEASTSEEVIEVPEAEEEEEEEEEENAMQLASEPVFIPEPVTKTQTLSEKMESIVETVVESGLVETNEGFTFRLPPGVLANIRASLKTTPHDGFMPVLDFDSRGNVILNFEPV
jgi:hypothetical protein